MTPITQYQPVHIIGENKPGQWLITCDHATNYIPPPYNNLGVSEDDLNRHIAYDIGALGVASALGEALNSPVIAANFSRLLIDPNRGEDDPTLIMQIYDGSIIQGNRHITLDDRLSRLKTYYRPYHDGYQALLDQHPNRAICAVHSFSPRLKGQYPRPWHIGVLHANDDRLSNHVIAQLQTLPDVCVGRNQPYKGHLPADSMDRHALRFGRHNTLLEIRNDLISDYHQQIKWANRLAPILTTALGDTNAQYHQGRYSNPD